MRNESKASKSPGLGENGRAMCSVCAIILMAVTLVAFAQAPKKAKQDDRVPVRYTDVRQAAGITFLQDATGTDEKYYLETMGTGVAWLDYDQDGLMDLYFVQSAATDIYKPPQPLRGALYHNNGDGTFTDVTDKAGVGGKRTLRPGRCGRRFRQRWLSRFVRDRLRQRHPLSQQR